MRLGPVVKGRNCNTLISSAVCLAGSLNSLVVMSQLSDQLQRFVDVFENESTTIADKFAELSDIYELIETLNTPEDYQQFLQQVIPVLIRQLDIVPISFDSSQCEHKVRHHILDILNRCILNQSFESHSMEVLEALITLLPLENEENGILCLKILTSLFKSFRAILQDRVTDFIAVIMQMYQNIPELVKNTFNETGSTSALSNEFTPLSDSVDTLMGNDDEKSVTKSESSNSLRSSMLSFKVLAECPITMVTLYSSYKHLTTTSLPEFTPLVMDLLNLQIDQQRKAHVEAEARNERYVPVSTEIKNRSAYCEFILAQIKATSFLAYVFIRGYAPDFLQNYVNFVPDLIIRLLQDCPFELSSARKELLHATRHILSTNYKKLFLQKLDYLFDEDVLIGKGFTTYETLRPLAYSTVADFIHNIRSELQLSDIEKTINIYAGYLLDETLALTVQIMSAKLLLNLVERILRLGKENPQESARAKKLLIIIVDAYMHRFKLLNSKYDSIMKAHQKYESDKTEKAQKLKKSIESHNIDGKDFMRGVLALPGENLNHMLTDPKPHGNDDGDNKNNDSDKHTGEDASGLNSVEDIEMTDQSPEEGHISVDIHDLEGNLPIQLLPHPNTDPVKDAFYLYRTLMSFLKTIMHDLKVFNPLPNEYTVAHQKLWASVSRVFTYEEVLVFKELFHECIIGLRFFSNYYGKTNRGPEKDRFDITAPSLPVSATKDGRELMDYLAYMFMQLDSSTFNEIIESEMDFIYHSMLQDSALLHIAQSFLTSEVTSPNFAGILLRFLKSKLMDLDISNFNTSNVLIRLFKLSFMSVNLFPNMNEMVLLPHLNSLILDSLKYAASTDEPLVYIYLIRTLFRSIGGGRFENLYRSIKPILQVLLQSLNNMILSARLPHERELYVELCITVPVRLSVLAPYLPYLMQPLVYALSEYPELVSQGLRTLELCIDNLTAEYFDPILEPVVEDVTKALFKLLQPQPFNHTISHNVVRILGKLGGRNRQFIKPPSDLNVSNELDIELNALFSVDGITDQLPLSITPGVQSAINILESYKTDLHYKESAFKYLSSILLLIIKSSISFPQNYTQLIETTVKTISLEKPEWKPHYKLDKVQNDSQYIQYSKLLERLIEAIFFAASINEIREESEKILYHLADHFCLLQVNNILLDRRNDNTTFNIDLEVPKHAIDCSVFSNGVSYALSSYSSKVRTMGMSILKRIYERSEVIYGPDLMFTHSFVFDLVKLFIHHCYEETYYRKRAGILGIQTLIKDIQFPPKYFKKLQFELVDAFLFTLKDTPSEAPSIVTRRAEELLIYTVKTISVDINEKLLESKVLQNTLTDIICELSNANAMVRKACQNSLSVMSEISNIPVSKLMEHSKQFLLSPIFAKPLRALPFTMQIGNIDAITYCVGLPNTFLKFNEEMFRLLQEAIVLADAEDESLSSIQKAAEYNTSEQLIQLRIACIKLLAIALKSEELVDAQQGNIRIRILAVFFKTMLKTSPEIINTTYEALKEALSDNAKLPKELLQNGLKPLLINLSDHQKLTISGLDALSKLLELLIAYFKVEIGRKLLDHLNAWCRVEVLDTLFGQDFRDQTQTQIVVSIINIFHLLPAQADMFLNDLLLKVMLLERKLRLQLDSPFRAPLAKYLNRFHEAVLDYFQKNMGLRQLVLFMCSIIERPEASNLCESFAKNLDTFYSYYDTNISINHSRAVSYFSNMVDLYSSIINVKGITWFVSNDYILSKLKGLLGKTLEIIAGNNFYVDRLQLNQAIEKFQNLHFQFFQNAKPGNAKLFEFIEFAASNNIKLCKEYDDKLFHSLVCLKDKREQNDLLSESLSFALQKTNNPSGIYVFKHLVNASLVYEIMRSGNLEAFFFAGKPTWLTTLLEEIWKSSDEKLLNSLDDQYDVYRFELLQLTLILVKWAPSHIEDVKKDVIKFCWNFIKLGDNLVKQSAYLVASEFMTKFDFPVRVITQVFVALLRSPQAEGRYVVKNSLDVLAPVLHSKTKTVKSTDDWTNWVKRVMFENSTSHNNTLYQFLINHPDLFFESRDLFISNIIHHMSKMSFISSSSPDSHTLAIDLAALILHWENKALKISTDKHMTIEDDIMMEDGDIENSQHGDETSKESSNKRSDYQIPINLRETAIAFLIRYICASNFRATETELGSKALSILSELLSPAHWPDVTVKLIYFEKFLVYQDLDHENILYYCMNALDVLQVLFASKPKNWILDNLGVIQNLLDKCLQADHHDIQEVLQKVLRVIYQAIKDTATEIKDEEESPGDSFIQNIITIINNDLQETSAVAAGVTLSWSLFMYFPDSLNPILPSLMKIFSKLCKDHLSAAQAKDAIALEEIKLTNKLLDRVFFILALKVSALGDSRRPFLSTVALLIDHSMNQEFLENIIGVVKNWVFNNDIFPTVKEKAAILTKMLAFEIRGEPSLSRQFFDVVLALFDQQQFNNSEITVRMEQPFLVGTRVNDVNIRQKFMTILNKSLEKDVKERLYYVIRDQNWEFIAEYPWLNQAIQILYFAFDQEQILSLHEDIGVSTPLLLTDLMPENIEVEVEIKNSKLDSFVQNHILSISSLCVVTTSSLFNPLIELFYQDSKVIQKTWINLFPQIYRCIHKNEKYGFVRSLITLLSKPYHTRQASSRINVINILLASIGELDTLELPPHLVKYLAISYNSWYESIRILEQMQDSNTIDNTKIIEANEDALLELYVNLQEEDMFYGLWRRKAKYTETNVALSFEQIGMWDKAQQLYELVQVKARSGALPYSESEYSLWEDNWIYCAEKLQHWDILTELAKHEGFTDLLLECGWRVADWTTDREALEQSVKSVMDVPTPRRQMFKTFLALQNFAETRKGDQEVRRLCDEGIQLSLHKWASLPERYVPAHKWLLHGFQQYMEFMEATGIYANLHSTTTQNLDSKAQEIKRILQAWRDRLPNIWDDVNIWNDLVTWRQHAFTVINNAYLPLIPALQQNNSHSNVNTHAYRGYHEIAWVINRFAHVARKHEMPEVCINQLARIYTLPNIEIQEAFLKLREQAKCHYQNTNELTTGLDVISNTNLVYFGTVQKAEFFTLKGMFLSKLLAYDEANQAFATAVQIDLNLAKAWAQWGFFNDRRLNEEPSNISYASNALSCYLQAAGLYKNSKIRELLCRILWLISMDDASGAIANAFDSFRGEVPIWYWITFIPQLLTSLSHKEAKMVRQILIRIAKSYPQALHCQLRTTKEDFAVIQRQTIAVIGEKQGNETKEGAEDSKDSTPRQPWEYLQELNSILKTAYPLLALSLESLVAQISERFKTTTDEDLFRLVNVLLIDGTFNYNRLPLPRKNTKLPTNTENNMIKFSNTLLAPYIRPKFNADFIDSKPDFETYLKRLNYWRRRLENKLDRAPRIQNLERVCPHLSNFHHQKFEDIEIPGQYLLNKDNNVHFIKIARFLPNVEFIRGTHTSYRRITIRGHDGSTHHFAIQYPAVRHSRREERMFQLFRLFNKSLSKNVETRRRNIELNLPIAVPLSPQVRLMNDSPSFTTLQQIYEEYCSRSKIDPNQIQEFISEKLSAAYNKNLPPPDMTVLKVEIFSSIQSSFIPSTILKNYFTSLFSQFEEFWLFRKQFASQYAGFVFMTYMMTINNRSPHKIHVDKNSGNIFTLEMLPSRYPYEKVKPLLKSRDVNLPPDTPMFHNNEPVPFRLTPNIQKLIGDSALEGVFSVDLFSISNALVKPENELNTYLTLFIRDEIISWYSNLHRPIIENPQLREMVQTNVSLIIKRVSQLSHIGPSPSVATQFIIDCINSAVSPRNLAKTDVNFMPWF